VVADWIAGVVAALAFGGGLVSGLAVRRRSKPGDAPEPVASASAEDQLRVAAARDAITAYGEQLNALSFDPSAEDSDERAIDYFRQALDSYSRASEASAVVDLTSARGRELALAALSEGRNALADLDRRRKETSELTAVVDGFEAELCGLCEDGDAVESAHRGAAVVACEEARGLLRSTEPGRREEFDAALARGRGELEARSRRRAESDQLCADIAALRAELTAVTLVADADAVERAHHAAARSALAQATEAVTGAGADRGAATAEAVRRGLAELQALADLDRRRKETSELTAVLDGFEQELRGLCEDGDAVESAHRGAAVAACEEARGLLRSTEPGRREEFDAALARGRGELEARSRRRAETDQLCADIAALRAELTAVTLVADADAVERAHHAAARSALAQATEAVTGAGADRGAATAEAVRRGLAELQALGNRQQESSALTKVVREFQQQLDAISFDPDQADPTGPALAEYREAQDALAAATVEHAGATAGRRKRVLAALGRGRAAVIRFEALRAGRPVPLELITRDELSAGQPERHRNSTEERFLFQGTGDGEFLLDLPEPGTPAILDVTVRGDGNFQLDYVRRTVAGSSRHRKVDAWQGEYRGREIVGPDVTHLAITAAGQNTWSIRVLPLSTARPLLTTARGHGNEVLHCDLAESGVLTVQLLRNQRTSLTYLDESRLRDLAWDQYPLMGRRLVSTRDSEFRSEEWIHGPGLLLLEARGDWALDLRPKPAPLNDVVIGPVDPQVQQRLLEILVEDTDEARARAVAELRRVTGAGPSVSRAYVADLAKHR